MKTNWLTDLLKRIGVIKSSTVSDSVTPPPDPEALKQIVRGIVATRPDEIGCDECFEQVDCFADLLLDGKDAAEVLPLVQDHLNRCDDCCEEFEALLTALKSMT